MKTDMEKRQSTKKTAVPLHVVAEESAALRRLWERARAMSSRGLTQKEFGEKYNVGGQAFVRQLINGERSINLRAAQKFASYFGCEISDFSPRLQKEADMINAVSGAGDLSIRDVVAGLTPENYELVRKLSVIDERRRDQIIKTINEEYENVLRVVQRLSGDKSASRVRKMARVIDEDDGMQ
jgi:transcriptional regulator with XRE-family HTH domain